MDRDERYFLQVSNADNLHEELFGGGKVSCFMLIQSQCTIQVQFHTSILKSCFIL